MRTKILILLAICTTAFACNKTEYTTKPKLSFKNISSTVVPLSGIFDFNIEVTDKEGDVQDTMWIQKISKICPSPKPPDKYKVPDFPAITNLKVDFIISCVYNAQASVTQYPVNGCANKNDTAIFKFWLKDKAGNISDTLTSPKIVLLKD